MRDDGRWWYDQQAVNGKRNDPWVNADMILPAFWLVRGNEFKITRSDDPIHTPLLRTTDNCLGGQTFRSKITNCGDFRDCKVWASNQCLWSCTVQYGGHVQIIWLRSQKLPLLFSLKVVVKLNMTLIMMPCEVPVLPVLLVELMAPSKIIRSLFSQLSLELKNVEKDDARFLSPFYLSFIIIRTWKLISPLEYKGGREGLVGTLPCVLFTLQKFQKVFTLNR